jgi:hypothetical protein
MRTRLLLRPLTPSWATIMYVIERTKGTCANEIGAGSRSHSVQIRAELEFTRSFEFRAADDRVEFKLNSIRSVQIADSRFRTSRNTQTPPHRRHLSRATQTGPSAFFTGHYPACESEDDGRAETAKRRRSSASFARKSRNLDVKKSHEVTQPQRRSCESAFDLDFSDHHVLAR